jgi:hypothetical protein
VAKNNRNIKIVNYPEEREGRIKDANKKLKSELKKEKNKVKKLKQDIATLQRAYNKSCEYISEKLAERNFDKVEDVIDLVNDFDYKETQRGREKIKIEKQKKEEKLSIKCPKCSTIKGEGYLVLKYESFDVASCKCGFRKKVTKSEGNEGS